MITRHFVHIALGIMMSDLFVWSARGIAAAALAALVSPVFTLAAFQGRGFFRQWSQADDLKTRVEEWGWRDYVWSYLGRAAWYTAVTLVTAQIARSHISA